MKLNVACVVFLASLITSFSSNAAWEKLDFTDTDVHHYIDIKRIDKNRKPYPGLWVLTDFPVPSSGHSYKSVVSYIEFDCALKKSRFNIIYAYDERVGKGKISQTFDTPSQFKMPPPGSPPEFYMTILCSR